MRPLYDGDAVRPGCVGLEAVVVDEAVRCMECGRLVPVGEVGVIVDMGGCDHWYGSCVDCVLWNIMRNEGGTAASAFLEIVKRAGADLN